MIITATITTMDNKDNGINDIDTKSFYLVGNGHFVDLSMVGTNLMNGNHFTEQGDPKNVSMRNPHGVDDFYSYYHVLIYHVRLGWSWYDFQAHEQFCQISLFPCVFGLKQNE